MKPPQKDGDFWGNSGISSPSEWRTTLLPALDMAKVAGPLSVGLPIIVGRSFIYLS